MRWWLVFPVVAFLLVAVACGDDGGPGGAASSTERGASTGDGDDDDVELSDGERRGPVPFAELRRGDCFNLVFDGQGRPDLSQPPVAVGCDELHNSEVVWTIRIRSQPGDPWPGGMLLQGAARDACGPRFHEYLGIGPPEFPAPLTRLWALPGQQSWAQGTRRIICYVTAGEAELRGSVEGAGGGVAPAHFPEGAPLPEGFELEGIGLAAERSQLSNFGRAALDGSGLEVDGLLFTSYFTRGFEELRQAVAAFDEALAGSAWTVLGRTELDDERPGRYEASYMLERDGKRMLVHAGRRLVSYYYLQE